MANHYTEFCFAYPLANDEQAQWALDFAHDLMLMEDAADERFTEHVDEFLDMYDYNWFSIEVGRHEWDGVLPAITLTSDEGGDPEHAAWFIEVLMQQFGHTVPISFGWSNTVSRPILDAYGGGAVTVTPKGSIWHVPSNDAWQARERYTRGFIGYWLYRANVQARVWRSKLSQATRKFRSDQRYTTYA